MNQSSSGFMGSVPVVTRNIIIINALLWLADSLLSKDGTLVNYLGLHFYESDLFRPHQIITYMFMHGSLGHVFFNMFAVFMFGRTLETVWGPKKFLLYYMLTGIGAALAQQAVYAFELREVLFNTGIQNINIGSAIVARQEFFNMLPPTVGASGAVFGILIAFGMLFPNIELYIIPFPFPIKAKWFVVMYGTMELVLGIMNNPNDSTAHFAHLGGLITGFFILLYWRKKDKSNGYFRR